MSLQTRLTALAQAVGADIKLLNSKVVTASAFSTKVKPSADWNIPAAQTAIPGLTVTVPDAGKYLVDFSSDMSIGPGNGYIIAYVAVNGAVATGSEAVIKQTYSTDPSARFPFSMEWLITANAGDVITIQMSNGGYVNNNISALHTSLVVFRPGGVKGDKGDPGTISVVTTLDWNTAITPNFYRSSNDFLNPTANNPGDTLNPPMTAGIVTVHQNGSLTQRVWDLDYQVGYTRYRGSGGVWSAWVSDVIKPVVFTAPSVGGATPQDGDERYFQNATMKARGIMWKFRYNKNSASTYKWEFVGGPIWVESVAGTHNTAASAWVDLPGGPSIIVPLAGAYVARGLVNAYRADSAAGSSSFGVSVAGSILLSIDAGPSMGHGVQMGVEGEIPCNSGDIWKLVYNSANGSYRSRSLAIIPVRVSM